MICLGIESTAHTFGIGIVDGKKVLANVKDLYTTQSGGIIPHKAAEHHADVCGDVLVQALEKAKISMKDVHLVAFSRSPGLGHCLKIGAAAARTLSNRYHKPLIGVNHCIAHLEIGRMLFTACKDPILLYVSGANTQIIGYDGGKYRIFGETLDIGVGNLLDTFARHIEIGFPGGPRIEALAKSGRSYVELPYSVKGMDISLGGIMTNIRQKADLGRYKTNDLCYSLQETVFAMLLEVSERALAHTGKKELLLGGGVACNKRLQEMASIMCTERGAQLYVPENQYLVDNGAMIAWLGLLQHRAGTRLASKYNLIDPYERTDDVNVYWR